MCAFTDSVNNWTDLRVQNTWVSTYSSARLVQVSWLTNTLCKVSSSTFYTLTFQLLRQSTCMRENYPCFNQSSLFDFHSWFSSVYFLIRGTFFSQTSSEDVFEIMRITDRWKVQLYLRCLMRPHCVHDKTEITFCINHVDFDCALMLFLMPLLHANRNNSLWARWDHTSFEQCLGFVLTTV